VILKRTKELDFTRIDLVDMFLQGSTLVVLQWAICYAQSNGHDEIVSYLKGIINKVF
jgi:hypothetical protein